MSCSSRNDDRRRRAEAIKSLRIFDEEIFYKDVFLPILADLGVERSELRRRASSREIVVVAGTRDPDG